MPMVGPQSRSLTDDIHMAGTGQPASQGAVWSHVYPAARVLSTSMFIYQTRALGSSAPPSRDCQRGVEDH